jgi:hypothetical protein
VSETTILSSSRRSTPWHTAGGESELFIGGFFLRTPHRTSANAHDHAANAHASRAIMLPSH